MYVRARDREGPAGLGWWVGQGPVPAGHEVLVSEAARGLITDQGDLVALIEGVRRPDTASLTAHVKPGEQMRHVLRRWISQGTAAALSDAVGHLRGLHRRILASRADRPEQFRLIGEALHLIQDAFAPAHVSRERGTNRILRIRNFGLANQLLPLPLQPTEHMFPVDPRDRIHSGMIHLTLKPEARDAIRASREFLEMVLRHIRQSPPGQQVDADASRFIARNLSTTGGVTIEGLGAVGDFGWAVKVLTSNEGHEILTRAAIGGGTVHFTVSGRPMSRSLSPAERGEIIAGNRSVDLGWMGTGVLFSLNKDEQRRHALRRELAQPQAAALADIVDSLRAQHRAILAEANPMRQLHRIGQVLHLIQDSFSPAHAERRPGAGWCISYIRNFGRGSAPREHDTPSDSRDQVVSSPAEAAQATTASRSYLQIVLKAIYGMNKPDGAAALEANLDLARFLTDTLRAC